MPLEIQMLMKGVENQDATLGAAVENQIAAGFDHSAAEPNMAHVAPAVVKFYQDLKRFMPSHDLFFCLGKVPLLL